MQSYEKKKWWKRSLVLAALFIGIFSLWYSNRLVKMLSSEEDKKIKLWANATEQLIQAEGEVNPFLLDIVKDNETIPVILTDDNGHINAVKNIDSTLTKDTLFLRQQIEIMKQQHEPIRILYDIHNRRYNYLYYKNSFILSQLKTYPIVQLLLIGLFAILAYLALSSSRKAEQNQVWVGMSKETAHQLGTPISSLKEWLNLIRESDKEEQETYLLEVENDIKRLELITERFSKIGSEPALKAENLDLVLEKSIHYLQSRAPSKVHFSIHIQQPGNWAMINIPLFDWVVENLCKNAIDAMSGEGKLNLTLSSFEDQIFIDVEDTGKGIPKSKFKTVFKPGYTTKKRGWGLGLSLVKRIIHEYHKGKIYVRHSEPGKGTTFRIVLNRV